MRVCTECRRRSANGKPASRRRSSSKTLVVVRYNKNVKLPGSRCMSCGVALHCLSVTFILTLLTSHPVIHDLSTSTYSSHEWADDVAVVTSIHRMTFLKISSYELTIAVLNVSVTVNLNNIVLSHEKDLLRPTRVVGDVAGEAVGADFKTFGQTWPEVSLDVVAVVKSLPQTQIHTFTASLPRRTASAAACICICICNSCIVMPYVAHVNILTHTATATATRQLFLKLEGHPVERMYKGPHPTAQLILKLRLALAARRQ